MQFLFSLGNYILSPDKVLKEFTGCKAPPLPIKVWKAIKTAMDSPGNPRWGGGTQQMLG